jgi:3-oxoacyl-[acyl-carrier-protein] synthase-3
MSNADWAKVVDTSDEWITSRTGIKERRFAAPDEACSDLCIAAARQAMEMAGVGPEDIDAVIVGTITGDMQFPATAVFVQDRIGARNALAFDLNAACSGFIFGVNVAHGLIVSGQARRVLVVGGEVLSKFIDREDRSTCVLFGDGAGAAVMDGCKAGEGILATHMGTDGSLADQLCIPVGGSRVPLVADGFDARGHYIKMKGDGVFRFAVRSMADATRRVVEDAGMSQEDIALLVPHQANMRIIDAVVDRLHIDKSRVIVTVDRFGNTSAATVPTAFDQAVREGRLNRGDIVVFAGFGGGFTWGATLFRHAIG